MSETLTHNGYTIDRHTFTTSDGWQYDVFINRNGDGEPIIRVMASQPGSGYLDCWDSTAPQKASSFLRLRNPEWIAPLAPQEILNQVQKEVS